MPGLHMETKTEIVNQSECVEEIVAKEHDGWSVRQIVPIPNNDDEWPCHAVVVFEREVTAS